jgi:hypothetical protein
MLTRGHHRENISLTGPFSDHEGLSDSQPTSSDATTQSASTAKPSDMSIKYRFTITYKDKKAALLVPGNIADKAISSIFKSDLRAFKINQPKNENVHLHEPGSVSFTLMRYENDDYNDVRLDLFS